MIILLLYPFFWIVGYLRENATHSQPALLLWGHGVPSYDRFSELCLSSLSAVKLYYYITMLQVEVPRLRLLVFRLNNTWMLTTTPQSEIGHIPWGWTLHSWPPDWVLKYLWLPVSSVSLTRKWRCPLPGHSTVIWNVPMSVICFQSLNIAGGKHFSWCTFSYAPGITC